MIHTAAISTNRDIERIVTKMEAVRGELGLDIDFAIECHWKYDTEDAIQLLNALEHVQPMWLEDPLPPENTDAMARLARATRTPGSARARIFTPCKGSGR